MRIRGWTTTESIPRKRRKEEASSHMVSLELIMLSCTINAKVSRYIIVTNIPGNFLYVVMEGTVHMLLEGEISKLIVKL